MTVRATEPLATPATKTPRAEIVDPIPLARELPPHERRHLPVLDGLRAIAVLLVLWDHAPGAIVPNWMTALAKWRNPGNFGVDLFFALSGFLITRILLAERADGVPVRYFLLRRAFRIFPVYYLLLLVMAIARPHPEIGWCAVYLSNFHSVVRDAHSSWLQHTWSLCVEEHFYAVWPLLVGLLPRRASHFVVAAIVVPGAVLAGVFFVALPAIEPIWRAIEAQIAAGTIDRFDRLGLVLFGTPCRVLSLALGSLLAYHESALCRRWQRSVAIAAIGLASATALSIGTPALCAAIGRHFRLPFPATDARLLIGVVSTSIATSSTLLLVLAVSSGRSKAAALVTALLAAAPLQAIGRISYGLYLLHLPLFRAFDVHRHAREGATWSVWGVIAGLFALATLSYVTVERPILRFAMRFRRAPSRAPLTGRTID